MSSTPTRRRSSASGRARSSGSTRGSSARSSAAAGAPSTSPRTGSSRSGPRAAGPPGAAGPRRSAPARSDDRFAQRRAGVRRQAARRRLNIIAAVTAASTMILAGIGLANSSLLDVDEVVVTGVQRADRADIVQAAAVRRGQPLVDLELDESARRVEQVPWVGTAEVRRSWTGIVEIAVVERGPVVALSAPGGFAMVDHWGRQLDIVTDRPEGFVPITGLEASGVAGEPAPAGTELVLHLVEALVPPVQDQISTINLVDGEVVVDLVSGGRARFGDGTQTELKVQTLETLLQRVDLQCLDTIDLSVPSAPSIRRIDENSTVADAQGQEPVASANDC